MLLALHRCVCTRHAFLAAVAAATVPAAAAAKQKQFKLVADITHPEDAYQCKETLRAEWLNDLHASKSKQ
jgi:hypothetical protein